MFLEPIEAIGGLIVGLERRSRCTEGMAEGSDRVSNGRRRHASVVADRVDAAECEDGLCSVPHRVPQHTLGSWMPVNFATGNSPCCKCSNTVMQFLCFQRV